MTGRLLSILYVASIFAQKTLGHEALALDGGSGLTNILMSAIANPVLGPEDKLSGLTAVCAKCYPKGIVQKEDLECTEKKKRQEQCKRDEECKCQMAKLRTMACPCRKSSCCEEEEKRKKDEDENHIPDDRLSDDSRFPAVIRGDEDDDGNGDDENED